jgi:hypothetical protein
MIYCIYNELVCSLKKPQVDHLPVKKQASFPWLDRYKFMVMTAIHTHLYLDSTSFDNSLEGLVPGIDYQFKHRLVDRIIRVLKSHIVTAYIDFSATSDV